MSQHDWEELLSAYADGEVTSAERSAVEALLETTPAARTALEEIRAVSLMLHALPQEAAPATLRTAALQAANQQATPAAASKRFRAYRREWFAGLSAIAMTLLVAGLLSLQFQSAPPTASPATIAAWHEGESLAPVVMTHTDDPHARGLRIEHFDSMADGVAFSDAVTATNEARLASRATPSPARDDAAAATALPEETRAKGLAEMPQEPGVEVAELDLLGTNAPQSGTFDDVERLREVLPYLRLQDESGQSIGNVELVVVDAQRVANQFQVLLMQNGVQTVDARTVDFDGDMSAVGADIKAAKKAAESQDLFAVYAEAPGEPLSKTLEELIKQREVLALKLQPPLQVAQQTEPERRTTGPSTQADRKLNFKQINDAYVVQQLDERLNEWAIEQPVSASDAVAVARGELPAETSNYALDGSERMRQFTTREELIRRPMLAAGATPSDLPAPGTRSDPASPSEGSQNLAFFNTLVKLQVPDPAEDAVNLGIKYQNQLQQNFSRDTRAGNIPLAADANDFMLMRSRFARTAPDTVRVLFVLHPVHANATPASSQPGR